MPGTSLMFETGPAGATYADGVSGMNIEAAGTSDSGFALFRIKM